MKRFALLAIAMLFCSPAVAQGPCQFDFSKLQFAGSAAEQAKCLLRPVKIGADLGEKLVSLPTPLDQLIGAPIALTKQQFRAYLAGRKIVEKDIGGSLDAPVSRAKNNQASAPLARYLVIHDTSTPNCSVGGCPKRGEFPPNINEATWRFNDKDLIHRSGGEPVAHVFVGRTGISRTGIDFKVPKRAVKLEGLGGSSRPAKGLFLHIENVQPRIGKPAIPAPGKKANDLIAPDPGFTAAQYQRLAVVYVAASVRRGEWLIPAFHAVVDSKIPNAHDDPQKFELQDWAKELATVIADVKGH